MKISEFLSKAKENLCGVSDTPVLDAEILLSEAIQKPRSFLYSRPEYMLSLSQKNTAGVFLQRRMLRTPVAYIIGKKEFYGLEFFVNENVLVPRPETELLAEKAIFLLQNGGTLLDVGTGSGSIAVTVSRSCKPDLIIATDISEEALIVAKQNAQTHGLSDIAFVQSDLLADVILPKNTPSPLVITANLPYVPDSERHPSVSCEPDGALFSGADGLDHYRRFFVEIENISFQHCVFEFHSPQKELLSRLLYNHFPNAFQEFFFDYSGQYRLGMISLE